MPCDVTARTTTAPHDQSKPKHRIGRRNPRLRVMEGHPASEFIVTRNTGDFTHSPVPAITPVEFLSQLAPP
jgi:hypothetical protein